MGHSGCVRKPTRRIRNTLRDPGANITSAIVFERFLAAEREMIRPVIFIALGLSRYCLVQMLRA